MLNSLFKGNRAIGHGANPARPGTPGGGSGGAIYNDGDKMKLTVAGSTARSQPRPRGGGAIFYVSNDRTGTMSISHSTLDANPNDGFHTAGLPGIFFLGRGRPVVAELSIR